MFEESGPIFFAQSLEDGDRVEKTLSWAEQYAQSIEVEEDLNSGKNLDTQPMAPVPNYSK